MDRLLSMKVFQRVADEGGFAAAGRALDLSAAAVTRLIADLEEHLGTRLLQRTTRRISLTDAGAAYLDRIRHILQDIEEADAAASANTQDLTGTLRLLAPPLLAVHILAPLVAAFRLRQPSIRLDIQVDSNEVPAVEDYDITLMGSVAGFDGRVIARPILTTVAVLVAAPAYLRGRTLPLQPLDLLQHDCLRLRPATCRPGPWQLEQAQTPSVPAQEVAVTPVLWANHTDTLLRAALDGAGISSQPVDLVAPYLRQGQLVRLLSPWVTGHYTLYAALPSRKFMPRRTRVFLDFLIEQTRLAVAAALQGQGAAPAGSDQSSVPSGS